MENIIYEGRLKELGLVSLKKRKLMRGDLMTIFKHLKSGCMEERDRLISASTGDKKRNNGFKLQQENSGWILPRTFS